MEKTFIQERLAQLVTAAKVSESRMSKDLGFNRSYIQGTTSGHALPKMEPFLKICDYLKITPEEFFHYDANKDKTLEKIIERFHSLSPDSKLALKDLLNRLD